MLSFLLSQTLRVALPFSKKAGPFCTPVSGTENSSCSAPLPGPLLVCSNLAIQIEWMSTSREEKRKDAAKEMEWGNSLLPSKGPVCFRGMKLGFMMHFTSWLGRLLLLPLSDLSWWRQNLFWEGRVNWGVQLASGPGSGRSTGRGWEETCHQRFHFRSIFSLGSKLCLQKVREASSCPKEKRPKAKLKDPF